MINETHMQHGKPWHGLSVRGWFESEKFRGVRAYWDGADMWSRGGLRVTLPAAWRAELPEGIPLDGEVFAAHGPENGPAEAEATAAVVRGNFTARLRFMVFDAPAVQAAWSQRMDYATRLLDGADIVRPVAYTRLTGTRDLEKRFAEVMRHGGEGLVIRAPVYDTYAAGRTGDIRKVKIDPALARGVVRCFA